MHGVRRVSGLVFLAAALGIQAPSPAARQAAAQGQQAGTQGQQQPPVPTFRAGVNFVRVDVIVSGRDGALVPDLAPADFEVTEDGKPQKIETFKLVRVDGIPKPGDPAPRAIRSEFDEESEAAREDVRLFAIFLDDYHVRRASAWAVRPALAAFVQKQLAPADLCGIMYPLLPVSALVLSRSQVDLVSAINHFEGRKYDYQPRNAFEEKYALYPALTVERIRNQVTLSALKSLVVHMGSLREGRKAVILVSEGFSNTLPAQVSDPIAVMSGMGNPARSAMGVESADDRSSFLANLDLQTDLRQVYDAANRNNTTIYTLDPRGLATSEFDMTAGVGAQTDRLYLQSTLDTLRTLAGETDGRAIINRNDLESGLKQVVQDSSAYYLLGYNSTHTDADGKFHEIKVRTRRAGVQVRARRGYWALSKEEMSRSLAPPPPPVPVAVNKALGSISEPKAGRFIRSWIGTAKGENGRTRVTFVWEPLPAPPGIARGQVTDVLVQASAGSRSFYKSPASPPAAPAPASAAPAGADASAPPPRPPTSVAFDADPGTMQLRLAVVGATGDTLDVEVREVKVPDLTGVHVSLSTPAVFRSATAREYQALVANPSPVPTANREFRRTERLLVRFEAYAPGTEVPAVTARVLNRVGNKMVDLEVRAPQAPSGFYQLDLPLAGFAPGEYLVEVKAAAAGGEATELVPLKIAG
jgi:VWFA-related protein